MAYYPTAVFTVFSFLGFLLVCIPFPWHLEAWNTGTCLFMAWTGIGCLNLAINSIIWNGNAINWAPVWCDISARIMIGVSVAIPAASLCINRRLYHIASITSVTLTRAEKRRAVMVDLAIGLGIPILIMILQYIPQGHRFDIFEDFGCFPATYITPVGLIIVDAPPFVIGLVSSVYSVLTIRAFFKRRSQFKELLSVNKNLNNSRYIRLMCLAGVDIIFTLPLTCWTLFGDIAGGAVAPWKGWVDTHTDFSRVDQFPAILWRMDPMTVAGLESNRWITVACAFIFFGFFGFADEAKKNYRIAAQSIVKLVGHSATSISSGIFSSHGRTKSDTFAGLQSAGKNGPTLPINVHREVLRKHDSLDSLSDMTTSSTEYGAFDDSDAKEKRHSPEPTLDSSAASRNSTEMPPSALRHVIDIV